MIRRPRINFARRFGIVAHAAATAACAGGAPTELPSAAPSPGVVLDTVASGLVVPWDLDFAPDGRIFVTERTGRVRIVERDTLRPEPWAQIGVTRRQELGLMGIALAPDFATSGHVYLVGAFQLEGAEKEDRVYRLTDRDGRGTDPRLILDGIPAARYHAGAALDFGPDGMLYVTTGDGMRPWRAGSRGSLGGKILRIRPDGGIPPDNPFHGSPVWALGLRNPQGLAWHPSTGDLFAPDHGPTGLPQEWFRTGRDELNEIRRAADYGWPASSGDEGGRGVVRPLVEWTPAIAPGGIAFYTGPHEPWRGDVFVAAMRGRALLRIRLARDASGWRAEAAERLFHDRIGRIRAVAMGRDGYLYITTTNRDGRGERGSGDDYLLRVVPPS